MNPVKMAREMFEKAFEKQQEMKGNEKPPLLQQCCEMGTYECQVPMPIKKRREDIDFCIADIVAALNAANIVSEASCCGHGHSGATILLEDGRIIFIKNVMKKLSPGEAIEKYIT